MRPSTSVARARGLRKEPARRARLPYYSACGLLGSRGVSFVADTRRIAPIQAALIASTPTATGRFASVSARHDAALPARGKGKPGKREGPARRGRTGPETSAAGGRLPAQERERALRPVDDG